MNRKIFEKEARKIFDSAYKTLCEKSRCYSPDYDCLRNFRCGGLHSLFLRAQEKTARGVQLTMPWRRNQKMKEGIKDTLLDGLNYHVIGLLLMKDRGLKKSAKP